MSLIEGYDIVSHTSAKLRLVNVQTDSNGQTYGTLSVNITNNENYLNVKDYGAVGDNSHDDTNAIRAAISAAQTGDVIFFPRGIYLITGSITFPGNIGFLGVGDSDSGSVIRVKTNAALTTSVFQSSAYVNNNTTCDNPVIFRDLYIDCSQTNAMSGANAHGITTINFYSRIQDCTIVGCSGNGIYATAHTLNGTHITNTCVEYKFIRLQVRNTGLNGIYVHDSETPLASLTDGFIEDCILSNLGSSGILVESGAGWTVHNNHIYGTAIHGILVQKAFATRIINNYIDGYGSGSNTFINGIGIECINGRESLVSFNTVNAESATSTGVYQFVSITGKGSGASRCVVIGNDVNGNSGNGSSIGFVIQAQGGQIGQPWTVDFISNRATGCPSEIFNDGNTTNGGLTFNGKIRATGDAPVLSGGTNNGTSPPTPTYIVSGNDSRGSVNGGSGTTPAAGNQWVITFNKPFATTPVAVVTPLNDATQQLGISCTVSTTALTVVSHTAPSGGQVVGTYKFSYMIMS